MNTMFCCFIISDDEQPSDRKTSSENAGYKRGQLLLDFSIFHRGNLRGPSLVRLPLPCPPAKRINMRERERGRKCKGEGTNWNCKSFKESHRARGSVEEHCRVRSLKSPGVTSRFREGTSVKRVADNEIAGDIRFVYLRFNNVSVPKIEVSGDWILSTPFRFAIACGLALRP